MKKLIFRTVFALALVFCYGFDVHAKDFFQIALQKIQKRNLEEKPIGLKLEKDLDIGMTAFDKGQFAAAERFLTEAIALTIQLKSYEVMPFERSSLLNLMTTVAFCYKNEHKYEECEKALTRALNFAKKNYGVDHINVSAQLNYLGDACSEKKDFSKAIEYYSQSLQIIEKAESYDLNPMGCVAYPELSNEYKDQIVADTKKKIYNCAKAMN